MNPPGHDIVGIFGGTLRGGMMVAVPWRGGLAPRTRWALRRVAVHLEAAYRLRATRTEADAVLDCSGNVLEARVEIDERAAREGVDALERASRLAKQKPEEAIAVWRGLIAGRWSLVSATTRGGRRKLLLRRNEVSEATGSEALTRRISSVAALAARGHSNKLIAYELGLPISTVASDLRVVRERLGLAKRSDLVHLAKLTPDG